MIKRFFFFFQVSMATLCGHAQLWEPLGNGFSNINFGGPRVLYVDNASNELLIGGQYIDTSNGDTLIYISKWNGEEFSSFGCGLDWECGNPLTIPPGGVNSIVRYDGDIIISGWFSSNCGNPIKRIVKLNGECWEDFGNANYTVKLKTYQDTLYACGIDTCAGLDCNGLAKWNGETWLPVHDMPLFESTSGLNANNIADFEWYQGNLYVGGNWSYNNSELNYNDFVMWNGTEWTPVGNGLTGTFAWVRKLLIFQDKLIVIGGFSGSNNPGNYIAAWDGENWDNMNGGFVHPNISGGYVPVLDAWATDEYLYVVGGFQYAGGLPSDGVARWDGEEWCGYGYGNYYDGMYWDNMINAVCIYNDELIVGGNFQNAGNDLNLNLIARYTGPGTCVYTSDIEKVQREEMLSIYPNPANEQLNIQLSSPSDVFIYTATGQLLETHTSKSNYQIDVSRYPSGLYLVVSGGVQRRFVRE